MDTSDDVVSRADHNRAVSAARTDGHAAGVTEGAKTGAKGERDRFSAVFGHEAYAGREKSAHHMLTTTDMTAEAITGVLAGLPAGGVSAEAPKTPEGRSKDAPGGLAQVDPASGSQATSEQNVSAGWSKAVAAQNARIN